MTVAVVLKGYPRLSETFIAQEIRALEQRGLDLALVSLRRPTDGAVHQVHREIVAPVLYLPEYLHEAPARVLRGLRLARRRTGWAAAFAAFRADLARDRSRNRLRRFGQACVLAAELPAGVTRLYAHFLHTPASVARYAALLTGLPWSVSAHAKDIWTSPDWDKREKLAEARWAVTCTRFGRDHLAALAPQPGRVHLLYHGLDRGRFPDWSAHRPPRDGGRDADPVRLLSIGRAVEKKGFDTLLDALARLPAGLAWRLDHYGGGVLRPTLQRQADALGLTARIAWHGSATQETLLEAYRQVDLFVLASRIADDGDRDGLPNVLMEAQSQTLPCLATSVSGVAELIETAVSGLLVPPADPDALADGLRQMITDPGLRARLGAAGAAAVRSRFDMEAGIDRLAALLRTDADTPPARDPAAAAD